MTDKDHAWYEDPAVEYLYLASSTKNMRGYHAPIVNPKITFTGTNSFIDFANFIGSYFRPEDKRLLIVVDKELRQLGEKTGNRLSEMKGFGYKIFDNVLSDAPKNTLMEGVDICKEFDPKAIVAIGGGSTMDTAKGIFLLYEKPNVNLNNLIIPSYLGLRKKIDLLIAIPTTSGTGSEATTTSVITDTDRNPPKKTTVTLYELCPDIAVLHYDYVKSLPPELTAGTGMDALSHALGAYLLTMSNVYTDMHNLKAIELILKYLPRAVKRGSDMEAREKMLLAAYIAGVGFSNVVTSFDHGLGHSFGAIFHVHHGAAVGIFLPNAVAFQAKISNRFIEVAQLFGVDIKEKSKDMILKELLEKLQKFARSFEFPLCVRELEHPKISYEAYMKEIDQMVNYAYKDVTRLFSTRRITMSQVRRLFEVGYENKIENLLDLYYH
ncbi:MAG: iron-containing alcohol dehydrogenase [Promethearchaeota archaeon]|nr:MAG: iron-containing alcohol dehydrogenase [Candidatus Lokiarchaeota archaeon]